MENYSGQSGLKTESLIKAALVTGIYLVLTLLLAPVAFGPIQFRLSEILNFLSLYNRRYIVAVTLGVFISNVYQFGLLDMVIGSLQTLVAMLIALSINKVLTRYLGKRISNSALTILHHLVLTLSFTIFMFPIAYTLVIVGAEAAFWPAYVSLMLSECLVMIIGIFVMIPLSKRINFYN